MEGLTKRDKDLKIVPGLAERWEIVDPLKWRFHLRKGVKFHDGRTSPPTTWCSRPSACAAPARRSRPARPPT